MSEFVTWMNDYGPVSWGFFVILVMLAGALVNLLCAIAILATNMLKRAMGE